MYMVLLILHVIITLALIVLILMQRSSSDGLSGMGSSGGGGGLISTRAQANLLTRTTAILATLFIVNSLALSILTKQNAEGDSIAEKVEQYKPAEPAVPLPDATVNDLPSAETLKADPVTVAPKDEVPTPVENKAGEGPSVPKPE
jgi:preprotein translocase subunit SecG